MKELVDLVNSSIAGRTSDLALQKKVWEALATYFRPDLALYGDTRPSVILARETGDLGLSVLWIVQTALARPVLNDLIRHTEVHDSIRQFTTRINDKTIISMAHSEAADAPVIYTLNGSTAAINGTKKFITAGRNSGVIMVTCRENGAPKIERVALLMNEEIPDGAMNPLEMKIMKTVDHTSLTLNNFSTDAKRLPPVDPRVIRRSVKKWGIIERALILESFIAFLLYCNYLFSDMGATVASEDEITALLDKQAEAASRQVDEASNAAEVSTANFGMTEIIKLTGRFQHMYMEKEHDLPEDIKIRLADLFLFTKLK